MKIELLRIGIVAPVIVMGIWIVAEESLFDRSFHRVNENSSSRKFRGLLAQIAFVTVAFLILASILVGVVSLRFIVIVGASFVLFIFYERSRSDDARRSERALVDAELPQLAQIMAILVSAGVSPIQSLAIISENSRSKTANEFERVVEDVNSGFSMISALDRFAQRTETRLSRRLSNTIAMALERGSPLTQVLIDFVRDARNEERNSIQRRAGRAEIALMIPVIFLILPISVLFALWPSLARLSEMI